MNQEKVGLFMDFENIFWGMKKRFNQTISVSTLINKAEKYGQFILGYAVADWSERSRNGSLIYPERLKRDLRAAGIEAVDAPKSSHADNKNLVDMKLSVLIFKTLKYRKDITTHVLMSSDGIFVDVVNMIRQDFHKRVIITGVPPISRELVNCVGEQHCDPLINAERERDNANGVLEGLFIRRMAEWEAKIVEGKYEYLGYQMLANLLSKAAEFKFSGHDSAERFLDKMIEVSGVVQRYPYPHHRGEVAAFRLNRNHSLVRAALTDRNVVSKSVLAIN
jgi:uncharacterized LabA/DUF88 family protein